MNIMKKHGPFYEDKRSSVNKHFKNLFEVPALVKPSAHSLNFVFISNISRSQQLKNLLETSNEHIMILYLFYSNQNETT